jgi:D-alanine-D-alanine ligase
VESLVAAIGMADEDGLVVEKQIIGREVTVGVLDGEPMGVVEIAPKSGRFDYASKYTKGFTEYTAPAALPDETTTKLRDYARQAFRVCGCRDFARIDFMIDQDGGPVFLEVNTLPGLKETSLLPMSANCEGLDFAALLVRMITPAINRFLQAHEQPVVRSNQS